MKKFFLILILSLGIFVSTIVNNAYAKYVLDKSVSAVSLETATLYNINYNLNGGSISGESSKYTINYSITLPEPIKKGYEFAGWSGSNGSNPIKNVVIQKGTTGNLSYNANWKPINYNISYNLNGGTLANKIDNYNIESPTFTIGTPVKNGYEFTGWSGSKTTIPRGSIDNLSYTANWKPVNYSISYNLNGGTLANKVNSYNIETPTFTIGTPIRNGYEFTGWSGSNTTIQKGTTGNLSYTANWKSKIYTVTYLNPDGSFYSSKSIEYNSVIPFIDYGVDQVHIFNGWFYNGQNINNVRMPESNINVIASIREVNGYIITGQATDGDDSRAYRFAELVAQKGLGGTVRWGGLGMEFLSNTSNYSHIMEAANHLLNNTSKNSWPYLRWLSVQFENGYSIQLR